MKTFFKFIILLLATSFNAQTKIAGLVLDKKQKPVAGANIFIEGTYDGGTTLNRWYFQL